MAVSANWNGKINRGHTYLTRKLMYYKLIESDTKAKREHDAIQKSIAAKRFKREKK